MDKNCIRCSICGREVPAERFCGLITDWGRVYESCTCVCEDCRRVLVERGNFNLWRERIKEG
jgi:hypothetical protein